MRDKSGDLVPLRLGETVVDFKDLLLGRQNHWDDWIALEVSSMSCTTHAHVHCLHCSDVSILSVCSEGMVHL